MGAFVVAALVALGTILVCGLMIGAASMSDAPSASEDMPIKSTFYTGMAVAALIAASHWLPHIGW